GAAADVTTGAVRRPVEFAVRFGECAGRELGESQRRKKAQREQPLDHRSTHFFRTSDGRSAANRRLLSQHSASAPPGPHQTEGQQKADTRKPAAIGCILICDQEQTWKLWAE